MAAGATHIAGIEIPSTDPIFLSVVGVHVLLGLACTVTGAIAMLSRKRAGRHPRYGTIYFWCLAGVFLTATGLAAARWAEDYHLFALGALSFASAYFDAVGLAQIMRVGWYREVTVKSLDCQAVRALLVARAQIVSQITTLKNSVRGILKTFGRVLPKGLRSQFPVRVRAAIDGHPVLEAIIEPTLRVLEAARAQLLVYDRAVIQRARSDNNARQLMSAPGVGSVVALAYITAIEDPARFKRSSSVAAYFGMTPRRYQSGEVDFAGRISKCGDGMVRGLLLEAAKVLLSRSARPSALKTWGETLGKRVGAKKATMAVARKLAVILHRMWTTGTTFQWNAEAGSSAA